MEITFAKNLKGLMKSENVTQTELAKEIGVAQSAVSAWVSGQKEPSLINLWLLADYFGVEIDFLVGRKD